MTEPGLSRLPVHHLDPGAQEFFPSSNLPSPSPPPPIFYPHPPPPYEGIVYTRPMFPSAPAFEPPPPPLPVSLPAPTPMPSRTLLLSMVPSSVSESTVRRELEVFGDVRAVQMERRREGLVTVHFYDVRDAEAALAAIQEQHMQQQFRLGRHYDAVLNNSVALIGVAPPLPNPTARGLISGRVVWAQFITPDTTGLPDGNNQGTLVVFNLDPGVSASSLMEIFGVFGPVKELRETPNKRNQRFVEFYDVRNAATAIDAVNGHQIYGRNVVIEYSRPGGQYRRPWKLPPNKTSSSSTKSNSPPAGGGLMKNNYSKCWPRSSKPVQKGNPSGSEGSKSSSSGSSLHGSVSNLCISNGSEESSSSFRRHNKFSSSKKASCYKQPTSYGGCSRPWKGGAARRGKDHDPRFLINEDAIVESDSRTTVMIKNIPNKYSQKLLLNMLDNHCIHCNEQITGGDDQPLSAYDFVYLPIDFINKCNVGYGFVNMTTPEATLRLYKAFHHQNWEVFNSRKICQVTYARLQGLEALREHFKSSKFPGNAEEYMPVVFSPPRDGETLTDPIPIIGPPQLPPSSTDENQSQVPSEVAS